MSGAALQKHQADKIAAAEKILSLILDPAERAAQVRHIAALKAALSRRLNTIRIAEGRPGR
jgi:hypothetical protein